MLTPENCQTLWDHIKDFRIAMLVSEATTPGQGNYHARPMGIVQDEFDGNLYFFTRRHSGKMAEIEEDHDVCLTFANEKDSLYVSVTGIARPVAGRELIEKYWNKYVAAWFPDGKDDPELGMLQVTVRKAEYWDNDKSKMVQLFEIAKANLTGTTPNMGENRKFG